MAPERSGTEIGATLRDARRRLGIEVKEAEARTKIRARYLRALENEQWETLPGPAYIRGFLRTYGQMLGVDGEMLADEYRRRYEEPVAPAAPGSEPLLTERRRPGERPPSRGPLIGAVAVGLVALLLILGLLGDGDGDDDEPAGDRDRPARQAEKDKKRRDGGRQNEPAALERVDVKLKANSGVQVCLVAGSDTALIDAQVLAAGAEEEFGGSKRYRLDLLTAGSVRFRVGAEKRDVEASEPVSLEGDSRGIREIEFAGGSCP